MELLTKLLRRLIALLCAVLFGMGVIWNLFCEPYEEQEIEDTQVIFDISKEELPEKNNWAQTFAVMRMERDTGWQELYAAIEQLEFAKKEELLEQYTGLQYKEQRLELLLAARGISDCLVVLEAAQANVIVPEEILQAQYRQVYDLVQRNTDYKETEIVLIPCR